MTVEVRAVRADDARVVPLIEAHVRLMDTATADPDACHRLDLTGLLAPHISFFGAFDGTDDEAIGIGAYAHFGDWGEVKSMHVRHDRRGRGVARRLLVEIEATARRHGASCLRLETSVDFVPAIALYESAGFASRGPFGGYPDHPISRFYEKRLA